MKKILPYIQLIILLTTLPMTSWAVDTFATYNSNIDNLIAGYGVNHQKNSADQFNVFALPSYPLIVDTGIAQGFFLKHPILPNASQTSVSLLANSFLTYTDNAADKVLNAILIFDPSVSLDRALQIADSKCTTSNRTQLNANDATCIQSKINVAFSSLDAANLLGPLVYTEAQDKTAKSYINALIESNNPLSLFNFPSEHNSSNKDYQVLVDEKKDYLSNIRAFAAAQAIALNNLSQSYAMRKPIDGNFLADHPEQNQAINKLTISRPEIFKNGTPSPLQLDNYMATRRITDLKWYDSLIHDTPASIERQQLMLLAENLAETHKTRLAIEQLNVTMSVLILQFSSQNRSILKNANSTSKLSNQ